ARWEPNGRLPFSVNLFDFRESDLAPRGLVPEGVPASQAESYKIKIGYNPVTGTQKPPDVQKDIWWYFALLVLGVLLVEWYVYNRRVYILTRVFILTRPWRPRARHEHPTITSRNSAGRTASAQAGRVAIASLVSGR